MAFVRIKRKGDRIYYYLVESKRDGKKVRQKVIKYLGTELEYADDTTLTHAIEGRQEF